MNNYTEWEHNDTYSRNFDNLEAVESMAPPESIMSVRDGISLKLNIQTQEIMDMNIKRAALHYGQTVLVMRQ